MAIHYRKLKEYKYQLMENYEIEISMSASTDIKSDFIKLSKDGDLTISKGYSWDGPSGPTVDTKNFMKAALVHDALYQLMRQGHLDYKAVRSKADLLLRKMCIEVGMSSFRAWYVHLALKLFGEKNARPKKNKKSKLFTAP
jgi:hypothetical protein